MPGGRNEHRDRQCGIAPQQRVRQVIAAQSAKAAVNSGVEQNPERQFVLCHPVEDAGDTADRHRDHVYALWYAFLVATLQIS